MRQDDIAHEDKTDPRIRNSEIAGPSPNKLPSRETGQVVSIAALVTVVMINTARRLLRAQVMAQHARSYRPHPPLALHLPRFGTLTTCRGQGVGQRHLGGVAACPPSVWDSDFGGWGGSFFLGISCLLVLLACTAKRKIGLVVPSSSQKMHCTSIDIVLGLPMRS